MKTVLILGAAGQIATVLTETLLTQTDYHLKLLARRADRRITVTDPERETVITGDFSDRATLDQALTGVDAVYLNEMRDLAAVTTVVRAMEAHHVQSLIAATVLGIEDEVPGKFGDWNTMMIASSSAKRKQTAAVVTQSSLDYTLLRLAWLFNDQHQLAYETTQSGQPFGGTEVSREAVAQLITAILQDQTGQYARQSLGVNQPGTQGDKPSFY